MAYGLERKVEGLSVALAVEIVGVAQNSDQQSQCEPSVMEDDGDDCGAG